MCEVVEVLSEFVELLSEFVEVLSEVVSGSVRQRYWVRFRTVV